MNHLRKILCAALATLMMLVGTACGGLSGLLLDDVTTAAPTPDTEPKEITEPEPEEEATEEETEKELEASKGLEFTSNGDGTCYMSGMGTCGDPDIVIPAVHNGERVTGIGDSAFLNCTNHTRSIVIPDSVSFIHEYAFGGGYFIGLNTITVAKGNPVYHSEGNCLIETASKTLILGCQSSVIPTDGSVTSMGVYAFCYCANVTSIIIPDCVRSIGGYAFYECANITHMEIPEGVTSIQAGSFMDCEQLLSVVIPDSVTSIQYLAFSRCTSLSHIWYTGTESEWNAIYKSSSWDSNTGSYTVHYNYVP